VLWRLRRRPPALLVVWTLWPIAFAVTVWLVRSGHADLGNVLLAGVVLFVAVYQAHVTVPGPAELWVERQYELERSDLIFYRYDAPGLPEGIQQPGDFLLQLDVAVANIGGRKALLSSLHLLRFLDECGEAVRLPEVPLPIAAQRYQQRFRWVGRERLRDAEVTFPPLMLGPDEVVTLRFRARRGIDWSSRWTLDLLRQAAQSLQRPISEAELLAVYRTGERVERQKIVVAVRTEQQEAFTRDLEQLAHGVTQVPKLPVRSFELE
jgi:hypothetical protein